MIKLVLFFLLFIPLQAQWVKQNAQVTKSKKISLFYSRVINPRFHSMDEKQVDIYFKEASRVCKEHFGLNVQFTARKKLSISELFKDFSPLLHEELPKYIYDFKNDEGDKAKLTEELFQTLATYSVKMPIEDMINFSKKYILSDKNYSDLKSLADALIDTEMTRLKAWTKVLALDGKPVIDAKPYNEWTYWDSLGYIKRDYDIIVTNQLISSAEYYGQDIHSALRGGIVAGTTTYAKGSKYGSLVFATSFLFLNNNPMIVKLRGDKIYTKEEAARYAGAYLAHELGHMLLALGHPFNRDACVMSPAKLLLFEKWYKNIDAKKCKIGSDKSMTPGDVELYYNDEW